MTCHLISLQTHHTFQLTRSRGAWLGAPYLDTIGIAFQLTRSRGAWLAAVLLHFQRFQISTHTLTWSVTLSGFKSLTYFTFQLTRSRGAWPSLAENSLLNLAFQLTRSRGAWRRWRYRLLRQLYFNSHAHVERDDSSDWGKADVGYFNSHAHVERDYTMVECDKCRGISTHTLTWSVTSKICLPISTTFSFQLTRSRGAWRNGFR